VLCFSLISAVAMHGQELTSPDHNISLTFTLGEEGVPIYTLTYKQRTVIKPSRLGFDLVGDASLKMRILGPRTTS
jgi:glucan 1,4-alpha-glucosidase